MSAAQDAGTTTLSTGHTVQLPLQTEATIAAAVFPASRSAVADLLPDGLVPGRAGIRSGAVTFLSVDYHHIGSGGIEPYTEFGVGIRAAEEGRGLPLLRPGGSFIHTLPVSTEAARALGEEVWGFPKEVADIAIRHDGDATSTTVRRDGDRVITFDVDHPAPGWTQRRRFHTYTVQDGDLLRTPVAFDGRLQLWPYGNGAAYEFGTHQSADAIARLEPGDREVVRFYGEGELTFHPGERI